MGMWGMTPWWAFSLWRDHIEQNSGGDQQLDVEPTMNEDWKHLRVQIQDRSNLLSQREEKQFQLLCDAIVSCRCVSTAYKM